MLSILQNYLKAGRYDGETIIFKSVMASAHQSKPSRERPQDSVVSAGTCAAPPAQICRVDAGSGASQAEYPAPAPLARSMNSEQAVQTPMPDAPNPATDQSASMSQHVHSDVTETTVCPGTVQPIDDAARPDPVILVETSILTPASQAALKKGNKIELREAFDLYIELKGAGYGDNFDGRQKRFPDKGKKWRKTSENNAKTAASAWVDIIGNQPFFQIDWTEAEEALGVIARIPTYHGKKKELINTDGFRELADRADRLEDESAALAQAQLDQKASVTPAEREKADLDARVPRLRVATYLRHGRMPNRVAKMLLSMKIIDEKPTQKLPFQQTTGGKRNFPAVTMTSWRSAVSGRSFRFQGDRNGRPKMAEGPYSTLLLFNTLVSREHFSLRSETRHNISDVRTRALLLHGT